jgi:integrase
MKKAQRGRRANQEGTYDYLPSGKVRLVKMVNGRRHYGPSGNTRQEAKDLFEKQLEDQAVANQQESPKFGFFYFEQLTRLNREMAATTYSLYATIYEVYVRKNPVSLIPLSDLRATDIERWLNSLPENLSPRTQQRYLQCVKALLEYAKKTGLIGMNPAGPVKAARAVEHVKKVLSRPEVDRLNQLAMSTRLRRAVTLCLHGLRRGEACALKYEDFDESGFTVRRSIQEVNGKVSVQESTKTGVNRWVPISDKSRSILGSGSGYVLETKSQAPLRPRNLTREWDSLVSGTEFEGMTLHDLRSTFATLLIQSGADVRTAAEILGHSPSMLAAVYARTKKEVKSNAVRNIFE